MSEWLKRYLTSPKKKNSRGNLAKKKNKRGKSLNDGKVWTCSQCSKDFNDADDKILECDGGCNRYFCAACIDLTDIQYETLQRPDCFWFCFDCVGKLKQMEALEKLQDGIETRLKSMERKLDEQDVRTHIEEIEKKMKNLEEKMEGKLDEITKNQEEVPENMKKTWADIASQNVNPATAPESFRNIVKETIVENERAQIDRENREPNLILYRVDESTLANPEERKRADEEYFNTLCEEVLDIGEVPVLQCTRLGKKSEGEDAGPRPMKIVLANKTDKPVIFRNLRKLKEAEDKFKKVSISNDYSEEERAAIKQKVDEAKKKTGEESKNWVFRVRGPPWNLTVIKTRKQE